MLEVIRDVHDETGRVVGMKPAGGIRTAKQAIQYLVRAQRDARPRVDDARPLPLRRLVAAQRRADADPQAAHRRLPDPATTSRSTDGREVARAPAPSRRRSSGSTRLRPRRATSSRSRSATGSTSAASRSTPRSRKWFPTISPATEEHARRGRAGRRRGTSISPSQAARGAFEDGWSALRPRRARQVPVPDRAPDPGALARARRRRVARTAASRSRSRATSTSRSPRRTSSTTRAGPTSSSTRSRTASRARSASPGRSSRGTSRC